MYASDVARGHEIPVGVVLWSKDRQFRGIRVIRPDERLSGLRHHAHDLGRIHFVQEQLLHWMSEGLPYAPGPLEPDDDGWWKHARELLIHGTQLTLPCPIDVEPSDEALSSLFASVVGPHMPAREHAKYINGQITECLGDLAPRFQANCHLNGFEGRMVRVTRAYRGRAGWVVVEAVNLTNQPDQAAWVTVGKLLSVKAATAAECIVGYLPPPHGLNGEAPLVKFIMKETGAIAFDLITEKDKLKDAAYKSVAKVGDQPQLEDGE
jgi:hypothetical protein